MAYERISDVKTKGDGFDVFIENTMKLYERQLLIRNTQDEGNFQRAVLEENLPLEAQLAYREEQKKRVTDDPAERKRVRDEIAFLKNSIEQKKFADDYLDKIIASESGIISVDHVIGWLQGQLASATDSGIRDTIRQQLAVKEKERFTAIQSMLKNQTDFALKDKSESVISTQVNKVSTERSKALLAGNNELVSVYDLQLQSLERTKRENGIETDLKNFAVSTVSGAASATALLDAYNTRIATAAVEGPITVAGINYASAREFWAFKRDSYVADTSSSGFLPRFSSEQETTLKVKNSQGTLSVNDVRSVTSDWNTVSRRAELQPYLANVQAYAQNAIQAGSDLLSNSIVNTYASTLNINKALTDLSSVKALGGNVEDSYSKLLSEASKVKTAQVSGIIEETLKILAETPGMSIADAVTKAVGVGAGGPVISPEQAATKTAEEIARESITAGQQGTFGTDPRTTATEPGAPQNVPPVVPEPVAPTPAAPTPSVPLSKQFDFGATDPQVRELQRFLNRQGFLLAEAGQPGSPGFETDYFGPATQAALKKFQSAQGIVSTGDPLSTGFGRLGPQTLTKIQSLF